MIESLRRDGDCPGAPRVAILTNAFTPYNLHLHQRLCQELPEIELWSLCTHAPSFSRWSELEAPAGVRTVHFDKGEPSNQQAQQRYAVREWRKAGRIIRWLQEHDIAAVLCQGYGDVGRLRVLRWCHRQQIPCYLYGDANIRGDADVPWLKRWFKRAVIRKAVGWATGVMVCGTNGRELYLQCGADENKTFLFPYLPDVALFSSPGDDVVDAVRRKYQLNPQRRRLLFSGRLVDDKRPDLLLAAFQRLAADRPDWDLLFVGAGPLEEQLRGQLRAELRDRIVWTGFVNDSDELAGLFANSDVLVLPSDKEPWGVVILEAAAAGMAIVTTDVVGAAADIVAPGRNGYIFPTGDGAALTKALSAVTSDEQVDAMKRQSPEVLEQWLQKADPVLNLTRALRHCGVLGEPTVGRRPRSPLAAR